MVCKIVKRNGNNAFDIDGKIHLPIAFRSFRPTPANVSLFYRNGVRLFQMQVSGINNRLGIPYSLYGGAWIGDHKYDFSVFDRQMEMFMKFAPDGYFMVMPLLDMPDWWRKENDCEVYSFYQLTEASFEEKWLSDASDYLTAFLQYAEQKYGDRIFAYSFSAGRTTEWFDGSGAPSERKMQDFRRYAGKSDIKDVTIEDIKDNCLPTLYEEGSIMPLYNRYCSEITPKIIARFAGAIQKVINHNKPIGIFYGYSCLPVHWQNQTATTGYESVWANDDIDMFFAPAEYYKARLPEGVSTYQSAVDSISALNKLYLHEIDHRTHLACFPMESGQMMNTDYSSAEETVRILRRELACVLYKDCAMWWFDFMGGYYSCPELEEEIKKQVEIINEFSAIPHESVAQIAFFVDPKSFHYMKDATPITQDCVASSRDSLNECGAPYDFFNLSDLTKIDLSRYKMLVFANALDIPNEIKDFIKDKLQDKTKVWIHAPNLYSGGIEEICGVKVEKTDQTDLKIEFEGKTFGFTKPTAPVFCVRDDECQPIAYSSCGQVAVAKKQNNIFVSTGNIPAELWRKIALDCGVHVYANEGGALYTDSRFIARQTVNADKLVITMPYDCDLYDVFDGVTYSTTDKTFICDNLKAETKIFMIKNKR